MSTGMKFNVAGFNKVRHPMALNIRFGSFQDKSARLAGAG